MSHRTHGSAPFEVAVVHGGPGAAGEMAPVARELARDRGILEPFQTADSLEGQVEELRATLRSAGSPPVALVGHSWGAWLAYLVAARHPELVRTLVLVGSGPFEERYVAELEATRRSRLDPEEREEWEAILRGLRGPAAGDRDARLARLGVLAAKADGYDPRPDEPGDADAIEARGDVFRRVWEAAAGWRRSGRLLEAGRRIRCPVVAIHGDHDPHPAEGVQEPLAGVLRDFRLVRLERCGHTPWRERQARDRFYEVVRRELG